MPINGSTNLVNWFSVLLLFWPSQESKLVQQEINTTIDKKLRLLIFSFLLTVEIKFMIYFNFMMILQIELWWSGINISMLEIVKQSYTIITFQIIAFFVRLRILHPGKPYAYHEDLPNGLQQLIEYYYDVIIHFKSKSFTCDHYHLC